MRFPYSFLASALVLMFPGRLLAADTPAPAARAASASEAVIKDLDYKSGDALTEYEKTRCKLDLYLPTRSSAQPFPVLVWFYGGSLMGGAKAGVKSIAERFAHDGIAVAAVDYRLSPKATYPAYLDDAAAAFAWVKAHASEYQIDPARVFVGGHSAGAYLAYMIGLDERWLKPYHLDPTAIAGVIPVSGQVLTHYTIRAERGVKNHELVYADEDAPINHLHPDAPPFLILYGDKDMVGRREGNAFLAISLRAAGDKHVRDLLVADRTHGSIVGNMVHAEDPAARAILRFIADPTAADASSH